MKDILIKTDISIRQAMKVLNGTAKKCLVVVDNNTRLLGTLTDGDLRRAILDGMGFNESIAAVYNPNPIVIEEGKSKEELRAYFLENKVDLMPEVDSQNNVVGYKTWEQIFGNGNSKVIYDLEVPVVVMAGGKGTRLEPFTKVLPKPLVPINEKPIIEHIIENFTEVGCSDFYLTVNYKGKILKAYFEELSPEYSVSFVDEPQPLGTAGSLKFLQGRFSKPFFVTNCDIIIKADYRELYRFHIEGDYDITLVASAKEYIIPYGTCELNGNGHLSHINEKPKYELLINTGLYIISPDILEMIPKNDFFHIDSKIKYLYFIILILKEYLKKKFLENHFYARKNN